MAEDEKSPKPPDAGQISARKPKVGDTIPAPVVAAASKTDQKAAAGDAGAAGGSTPPKPGGAANARKRSNAPRRPRSTPKPDGGGDVQASDNGNDAAAGSGETRQSQRRQQPQQSRSGDGSAPSKSESGQGRQNQGGSRQGEAGQESAPSGTAKRRRRSRGGGGQGNGGQGGQGGPKPKPQNLGVVEAVLTDLDGPIELDAATLKQRKGRSRKGRAVGRYQMNVHVTSGGATHVAVLEGRQLIEYYAARPSDDELQIHGNIYLGRVENVLPGMEAAFIDIGTQKNAVLYRGDVQFDREDVDSRAEPPRIEEMLKSKQMILCQVTKNPIAHKGARVTQEVSLPGRFVVLVPNSTTYGISKRLPDEERRRLRSILDRARPPEHGVIVRTAAKGVTAEEIERDVARLLRQWEQIDQLAKKQKRAGLLYREPDLAARLIREEFNSEYRAVVIDDPALFTEMSEYVAAISPAMGDRVRYFDRAVEPLPLFERFHVHEQLHRALEEKVWLPSGGSLVIQHTEALTVIDVNTGKNVGTSSLEETVFRNNVEAAEEIAKQLRLRDIGGIIAGVSDLRPWTRGNDPQAHWRGPGRIVHGCVHSL